MYCKPTTRWFAAGVWCDASQAAGAVWGALATKTGSWDIERHLGWEVARASAGSKAVPHGCIWAHSVENTGSGYSQIRAGLSALPEFDEQCKPPVEEFGEVKEKDFQMTQEESSILNRLGLYLIIFKVLLQ